MNVGQDNALELARRLAFALESARQVTLASAPKTIESEKAGDAPLA